MTVSEDVGNVLVSSTVDGKTSVPFTVDITLHGTATQASGKYCFL